MSLVNCTCITLFALNLFLSLQIKFPKMTYQNKIEQKKNKINTKILILVRKVYFENLVYKRFINVLYTSRMNTCKYEINEFRLTGKDYYAFSCYLIYPWYRNSKDEIFISHIRKG